MEDQFPYPVFFDCSSLNSEQRKKIENYFQIRQKSGGGDCSCVTNIQDQVYRISFRQPDAQQRVLQKSEHVLELAGVPLVLNVRGSPDPTGQSVIPKLDPVSLLAFKSALVAAQLKGFTRDVHQPNQVSTKKRIVLLGETGSGKSSLGNTIFGEKLFDANHTPNSGTSVCQAETKSLSGSSITLIDTPGLFGTDRSEEELKPEIVRCITECAPGPHAFLIVLKVEKFTEHKQAVVTKICQSFSEKALKYAVIVFTHGDQLPKGMKIEEFVSQNKSLSDLVKKCGGRCHVIDNRYWEKNEDDDYRCNRFQVTELLNTVDEMVMENNGGYYGNEMLEAVEKEIQKEEEKIRQTSGNMLVEVIRKQAKTLVFGGFMTRLAGTATGVVLGAFFGLKAMARSVIKAIKSSAPEGLAAVAEAVVEAVATGVKDTFVGAVKGGISGYHASKDAKTPLGAVIMAANAVCNEGTAALM